MMSNTKHNFRFGTPALDGLVELWHSWCHKHKVYDKPDVNDFKPITAERFVPNAEDVDYDPSAYDLDSDQIRFVKSFMCLYEVAIEMEDM